MRGMDAEEWVMMERVVDGTCVVSLTSVVAALSSLVSNSGNASCSDGAH